MNGLPIEEGFWWPSDVVPEVWVDAECGLSRSQAAMITAAARARAMAWIGGRGLHPVEIYDRFAQGCFLHGCGGALVADGVESLIGGNRDLRWRGLMDLIFGKLAARERVSLENDIHGVLLGASVDGKLPAAAGASGAAFYHETWFMMLSRVDDFVAHASSHPADGGPFFDLGGVVPIAEMGPDELLMEVEDMKDSGFGIQDSGADALIAGTVTELVGWAASALLAFLAEGGTEPFRVVQRFYGLCFLRFKSLVGRMNGRDLAGIMSQGRAQFSAMEKRVFTDPVEWITGEVMKVDGQKVASASVKYAANAAAHKPRQMLNGQAGERGLDSDLDRALKSAAGQRRAAELRLAAREREAAALEREWRERFKGSAAAGSGKLSAHRVASATAASQRGE